MNMIVVLAILLVINMLLMHGDRLIDFYYLIYKRLRKPKFKTNELVMIEGIEYQVLIISENVPFYNYYCCPLHHPSICRYFHETQLNKKTGLLKELE